MTTGLYLVSYRERHVCACLYHIQSVVKVYRHNCNHKGNEKYNTIQNSSHYAQYTNVFLEEFKKS